MLIMLVFFGVMSVSLVVGVFQVTATTSTTTWVPGTSWIIPETYCGVTQLTGTSGNGGIRLSSITDLGMSAYGGLNIWDTGGVEIAIDSYQSGYSYNFGDSSQYSYHITASWVFNGFFQQTNGNG